MTECRESYKECVASRQARVKKVLATAAPGDTIERLAERAEVTPRTINRAKALLQTATAVAVCNSSPLLKLRDMYAQDVPYWDEREVRAVERALQSCNKQQLAYLFAEVLPVFLENLRRGNVK